MAGYKQRYKSQTRVHDRIERRFGKGGVSFLGHGQRQERLAILRSAAHFLSRIRNGERTG